MKSTLKTTLFCLSAAMIFQGCAHTKEKAVEAKVAQETQVNNIRDLRQQSEQMIDESNLSDEKKAQLKALRQDATSKMASLHQEGLRLRSLLIKDMLATKFDRNEVNIVRKKIKKNQDAQLALLFDSVDKANLIMGRETDIHFREQMMDQMFTPNMDDHMNSHMVQ